jgi:hypothetical protein
MRHSWFSAAALFIVACSTPPAAPSPPTYSEAVAALIAATRTSEPFQSTTMMEVKPCTFLYEISPGRQSTLGIW